MTDDYRSYPAFVAGEWIWKVFPPILIFLGTIGNTMSIVVLSQKPMRDSSVSVYLIALSVVDILVLYTGLLRQWLRVLIVVDVRTLSEASCKFHTWLVYVTLDMSVWLLVSVTAERFVSVWFPHKVKRYCTTLTAVLSMAIIGAFLLTLNSHYLYGLGDVVVEKGGETVITRCTSLLEDYDQFASKVWPWIDLCFFSLIPLFILSLANISIIYKVFASKRQARRVHPAPNASTSTAQVRGRKLSSLTVMLLVLNVVFFICTLPISIFLIIEPYWVIDATPRLQADLSLGWAIVNVLMYTNNSINFLLYCLSGSRFRDTLKALFVRQRERIHRTSISPMRSNISILPGSDVKPKTESNQEQVQLGNTLTVPSRATKERSH